MHNTTDKVRDILSSQFSKLPLFGGYSDMRAATQRKFCSKSYAIWYSNNYVVQNCIVNYIVIRYILQNCTVNFVIKERIDVLPSFIILPFHTHTYTHALTHICYLYFKN